MSLIPLLVSCNTAEETELKRDTSDEGLASNFAAFEMIDILLIKSIPFVKRYTKKYYEKPSPNDFEMIKKVSEYSLKLAIKTRYNIEEDEEDEDEAPQAFDVASDLLLACLQLYSDHRLNFAVLEDNCYILTLYLLAFPTFKDENLKVLVLK